MRDKLIKGTLFFIFVTMLLQDSFALNTSIDFIQADHKTVTRLSTFESKHFFVNYSADWCATCEVMEETSNANPTLVDFINKKFIAVKANVDNAQGKLWQTQYGVTCLPTLIVFSPDGKEVARKKGGITSSEFLVFLQQFETLPTQSYTVNNKPNKQFNTTESNLNHTLTISTDNFKLTRKGEAIKNKSKAISSLKNYGVKVGMYSELKNANLKIDRLKKELNQPVILRFEKVREELIYQVIIGEYSLEKEATQLVSSLKSKGIKGHVIKL